MKDAARKILMERRKRDVYIIGAANVGKSAFVRALIKEMSDFESRAFDPAAHMQGRFLPVESAVPGTTLGIIPLQAFESGGTLYDTPGVHLHHRLQHMLTPQEVSELHPRKKLGTYVAPPPSTEPGQVTSYLWGSLFKLEITRCVGDTQVVFYGPNCLKVAHQASDQSLSYGEPGTLGGAFGEESVVKRGGWRLARELSIGISPPSVSSNDDDEEGMGYGFSSQSTATQPYDDHNGSANDDDEAQLRPILEIAVSGILGWVSIYANRESSGTLSLKTYAPVGAEVFFRPPMMRNFPKPKKKRKKSVAADAPRTED
eukprot:CAMPEP_0167777460 /NCGR_PEP_ID=MMETSP0111_2-20121227/3716_1 /TAXON_ID=91324 /ORGANISM="Lotharella globosa, Strain CCCM811" /LENGTH=314 /DNA_ID=CAMNT_0007667667 /DNA_START=188 /DNA_END=1132 /DNA_ORIENTATION=+